jgi:hypothetical protein
MLKGAGKQTPGFAPRQTFGPTYENRGLNDDGKRGRGRGGTDRGRGGHRKYPRNNDPICPAYDSPIHNLADYYTAFPKKAY